MADADLLSRVQDRQPLDSKWTAGGRAGGLALSRAGGHSENCDEDVQRFHRSCLQGMCGSTLRSACAASCKQL